MARLHEYQGKAILAANGFQIPRGRAASTAKEAVAIAKELGGEVVVKIQAWTTGRAGIGGVAFAKKPDDVRAHAERMLSMKVGQFPVEAVLVEEKIDIDREFFLSFAIDDAARAPVIIFAGGGGTGIEERAASTRRIPCDVRTGPTDTALSEAVESCGLSSKHAKVLAESIRKLFGAARSVEARSLEINPLVVTKDGEFVAADCRITIDDYAVARHPELKIEIAREFDHPPTELERVAYAVEQSDHRGTFYFAQLATAAAKDSRGLVGFHGAGGGGSMMSMDAIVNAGFTIANFTDTSGNPSASKVYRAARIILAQPDLVGYFGSGSGVASQEQYWSAYGLAKAFWELDLGIPAVIRLGGNTEDRAVDILHRMSKLLRAPVEGYRKSDTPATIATRFAELVAEAKNAKWKPRAPRAPEFVKNKSSVMLAVKNGRVWIDTAQWPQIRSAIETHSGGLIVDHKGVPAPSLPDEEFATKDSELLACDVECRLARIEGFYLELDIPRVDELV
ncbi:MAG TPA: ATP-grasp domain-containing protein [Candidatus Limnocylindria bacterium]|jgi:succinyl-CoA synthetase beta subunit|nr:ATP-grasp domain-containing protein [Candidatus Limnocylindria bacterium]